MKQLKPELSSGTGAEEVMAVRTISTGSFTASGRGLRRKPRTLFFYSCISHQRARKRRMPAVGLSCIRESQSKRTRCVWHDYL